MELFYVVIEHPLRRFESKPQENKDFGAKTSANVVVDLIDSVLSGEAATLHITDKHNEIQIMTKRILEESFIKMVVYEDN